MIVRTRARGARRAARPQPQGDRAHVAAGRDDSPATACSRTRRSWGRARSRTRAASTSTACSRNRATYEIMDPVEIGLEGNQLVLGKHSRPARVRRRARQDRASRSTTTTCNRAFARFKDLADRKIQITDQDLAAIVAEEVGAAEGGRSRARVAPGRAAARTWRRRRPCGSARGDEVDRGVRDGRRDDRRRDAARSSVRRASRPGSSRSTCRRHRRVPTR